MVWSRKAKVVALLCAVTAACAAALYLEWSRSVTHSCWLLAAAVGLYFAGSYFWESSSRRMRRCGLVFGFLFAVAQLMGYRLGRLDSLVSVYSPARSILWLLLAGASLAPAAGCLCLAADRLLKTRPPATPQRSFCRAFWLNFALILLCWLPVFLAFYPGLWNYDVDSQITQVLSGEYSTKSPLLHTLLLGAFYRAGEAVGSVNAGVALYSAFQMLAMAGTMAYGLAWLHILGSARWARIAALVVYALFPVCSMLAVSTAKDGFFAGLLLLACVLLFQAVRQPELVRQRSFCVRLAFTALGIGLIRNNGVLTLVFVAVVLGVAALSGRETGKRLLAFWLCGAVLFGAASLGLKAATGAESGSVAEALSVPMQQLGRVYESKPYEIRREIKTYMPHAELYHSDRSDYIKHEANITGENLRGFVSLWLREFKNNPMAYMDAFAALSQGCWYLDDLNQATTYGESRDIRHGYIFTDYIQIGGVTEQSLWPGLKELYTNLFTFNEYLNIPLLGSLLSVGLWCWSLLLAMCCALIRRDRAVLLAASVPFSVYVGIFFGPCVLARYALPILLCVPLLLGLLTLPKPAKTKNEEMSGA